MVTGRPPFVGDDSVSIIGQHINTPPVSPAWHRADLPPALETLIMQLLEKDPEKRPESASVVLQALEAIEAGKLKKEPSKEAAPSENPLYRRVFVGREPELRQLQGAFDGAMSGQGALMMVMGEPGIGKTVLCEQLSTYATLRGGRTLLGHCYEEGSLSLPYLAFVEALRSYVLSREIKDLREELGTGAADVARIVSEIRERLKVKLRPQKDPEEERYRLLQAVTSFLTNAACVQPMLVVLEDLHDADKGTLDMLTHVSRHLSGTRLLIVGTYRDVEVDRSHPLSAALAELRRVSSYGRVILRGLNADEVRRMLESITRESVPWGLAEAVHRQTEGNPLFVQEVVRYLAEEGLITQKEGRWRPTKDTPLEMNIPEGLRDVIGKRLSLLSKECNQLLSVAAVIGREFAMDTLKAVVNINEDIFVSALKDAVHLSVLEERSQVGVVRYRFTHAFFRQTLYEEMIAPQRLKLHQQVARALESQYAKRLEEHAAELAEHFSQSTDPTDLTKAIKYGEMAAKRANGVYAYGEAVRLLEQALKVQRVLDPNDKSKLCDLLLKISEAENGVVGGPRHALDAVLPEAYSLAESIGDKKRISQFCFAAITSLWTLAGVNAFATPEAKLWVERADIYAESETPARAWADVGMGCLKYFQGSALQQYSLVAEGINLLNRSLELARRLNDYEIFSAVAWTWFILVSGIQHLKKRLQLAEEIASGPRIRGAINLQAYFWSANIFLEFGQRGRSEELFRYWKEITRHIDTPPQLLFSMIPDGVLATLDGRLEVAEEICHRIFTRAEEMELDITFPRAVSHMAGLSSMIYLGRGEKAFAYIQDTINFANLSIMKCVYLGKSGHNSEVEESLDKFVLERSRLAQEGDESGVSEYIFDLEAAVLVGHHGAVEFLLPRLKNSGYITGGLYRLTCIARHLGGAAALLERYDDARQYYQEAIKVCTEMRFRPELALTRLQIAELLLEHYPDEKKEALEHLDFAIKEFREMKMQPSLERALRHKDILKA